MADENEPDIRLQARSADASVPIEIKDTGSEWSLRDLETGLADQLCGRYLRARNSRHGIYLIVHRQPRPIGWRAEDGRVLQFDAMVRHLQGVADCIAGQSTEAPQVRVCAIDVCDM